MPNKVITVFSLMLFLYSCDSSLTPYEFKKYVENDENGYISNIDNGTFSIQLLYTPPEYLAVSYLRSNKIKSSDFKTLVDGYQDFDTYKLSIRSDDPKSMGGISSYLSFYMQPQIKKVCGTDTAECIIYQAEPYNAIDGQQKIEIGFQKNNCNQEAWIVLKDTPLSTTEINIPVPKPEKQTPQIELY